MSDDNINTETTIIPPVDSSSTSTSSTSPSLTSSSTSLSITSTSTSPSSITSTSTSLSTSTLAPVSENNSTFAPSPSKKLFPGFDSTPLVAPVSKPAPPPDEGQDSPAKGHQRDKLSGLTRCFNPPKLERKHSSGDLQSRLKTRKILGVGETDNGDIHRSKISQVLGHNEHLYVRFPKGMWATHVLLGVLITIEALVLLLVPSLAGTLGLIPSHVIAAECPMASLRLIGAALSGLALFVWAVLGTTDKHYERTALLALVVYNSLCVGISVGSTLLQGTLCRGAVAFCVGLRTSLCFLCLAYFQQIVGYQPIRGQRSAFSPRTSPSAFNKQS